MAYRKIEEYDEAITASIYKELQRKYSCLEDPEREGLLENTRTDGKAMQYPHEYSLDAKPCLNQQFHESVSEMVIVKTLKSMVYCEHHIRMLHIYQMVTSPPEQDSQGCWCVQPPHCRCRERLTHEILMAIKESLNPIGVAVGYWHRTFAWWWGNPNRIRLPLLLFGEFERMKPGVNSWNSSAPNFIKLRFQ